MPIAPLVPANQALRRALEWLIEHGEWTAQGVEEACRRFDVAPLDEEFLLEEMRRRHGRSP